MKPWPPEYDICLLTLKDGKCVKGWWTGHSWWGRKLQRTDIVVDWERLKDIRYIKSEKRY